MPLLKYLCLVLSHPNFPHKWRSSKVLLAQYLALYKFNHIITGLYLPRSPPRSRHSNWIMVLLILCLHFNMSLDSRKFLCTLGLLKKERQNTVRTNIKLDWMPLHDFMLDKNNLGSSIWIHLLSFWMIKYLNIEKDWFSPSDFNGQKSSKKSKWSRKGVHCSSEGLELYHNVPLFFSYTACAAV